MQEKNSIYQFTIPSIDGGTINFLEYKGKKILIVNTASECLYTIQFAQLQELHENFQSKLAIIGFPSNDFGEQEPGTNNEIKNFCKYKYGVTFQLATKSNVIGNQANPIFKYLTSLDFDSEINKNISWNFQKYLLDETGKLIAVFPPEVEPMNDTMMQLLNSKVNL